MGVTGAKRRGLAKISAVFILVILLSASVPSAASVFDFLYSSNTATVRSPSVSLASGTAGSSIVSSVQADAATVSASAGVHYYVAGSAPVVVPAIDGSGTGSSIGGSSRLVQVASNACTTATSCSEPFPSSVTSGHLVVVSVEWNAAVTSPTLADGEGGAVCASFTQVSGSPVTNTAEAAMWYCTASSSGAMAPSVSWTTAAAAKLDVYEITGYTVVGMGCSTGTGTSGALSTSSTVAFSGPAFLVAAWAISTAKTVSAGTGFTLSDTSVAGDGGSGEYAASGVASPTGFPATRASGGPANNWAGVGCQFPPVPGTTASATLTTTGTSDLVYVVVGILNAGSQTVSSVSDTSSLSFARRSGVSYGTNVRIETWYAAATSALSSDVVTVALSGPADAVVMAMGVSGTDPTSPFDPALASPAYSSGTGTAASASLTTSNPNDLIIGAVVAQNNPAISTGGGFTAVAAVGSPTNSIGASAESQAVTSTQTGTSVPFTLGASQNWVVIADAVMAGTPAATADATASVPAASGSFALNPGYSALLWSDGYPAGGTIYAGSWLLDLWASRGVSTGTVTVSIYVVNSTNQVVATVLGSGTSGTIQKSETEVLTSLAGAGATIPAGGSILVVLTNPGGGQTVTVYWGTAQLTSFETPTTYNYVLGISNGASSTWTVSLATQTSLTGTLGRLSNATIWFTAPSFSKQIVVTNGALAQSSGAGTTLAGPGTIQIAIAVYSTTTPTASTAPSTITVSLQLVSTTSTASARYTIVFVID